jgi:hypothetical protein
LCQPQYDNVVDMHENSPGRHTSESSHVQAADYLRGRVSTWERQILFAKDIDPLGPNYFLIREKAVTLTLCQAGEIICENKRIRSNEPLARGFALETVTNKRYIRKRKII